MRKRKLKRKIIIWIMLIIGFGAMEFPGIFYVQHKIESYIFSMPFIYGYILCWWIYMCLVIFAAYKLNWGNEPDKRKDKSKGKRDE